MEVILRDMVKSHHLFICTLLLIVGALWDVSLLERWVMHDVLTHDQVGRFGLQICLVYAIFKLVSILSHLSGPTDLTLVEKGPFGAILGLIGIEHVVALLAKSLTCELSCH